MSKLILAAAATLLLASPALAAPATDTDNDAPVRVVSARGVNLSDPAQAQHFYAQLQHAAREVCQAGADGRGAAGTEDLTCVRENMQSAVRAANAPRLTAMLGNTYGPGVARSTAFATDAR